MFSFLIPKFSIFTKKQRPPVAPHKPASSNMVEPLQYQFSCTKDLFQYAKKRCVDALHSESPYEHVVVADIKKNKVLAEYKGNENSCNLDGFEKLEIDKDSTMLLHGHPEDFPLSSPDVNVLLKYNIGQVLAFDKNGKFSLMAKDVGYKPNKTKEFLDFRLEQYDVDEMCFSPKDKTLYCAVTDDILKKHAPLMGLRYVSNYPVSIMNSKKSSNI